MKRQKILIYQNIQYKGIYLTYYHYQIREIFNKIMESINDNNYNYNKCFFIDGPSGSGKSYLLNSLITHLNNENINVLPVAWTGIAAIYY